MKDGGLASRRTLIKAISLIKVTVVFFVLLCSTHIHAQERTLTVTLNSVKDSVIVLSDNFPDFSTLRIQVDRSFFLEYSKDFTIDTAARSIIFSPKLRELLYPLNAAAGLHHSFDIHYTALPISLKTSYSLNQLESLPSTDSIGKLFDTSNHVIQKLEAAEADTSHHGDFLNNFQKSGSISRGFQVGSNHDLGLTSGFNLQFSGNVSSDVSIMGALTEDQTPIQPEGTTQTLNEIDNVFIRIKAGTHFESTLGDFNLDLNSPTDPTLALDKAPSTNTAIQFQSPAPLGVSTGPINPFKAFSQSTFDLISRKLIGAEAIGLFDGGSVTIAGGSPRGQFTTNTIQGQEAFQGPYTLVGKNGEPTILIVAGSEHVYVDGVLQTRGEKNDYIIDYALAQITFQPRRLITSDSRITVDFEYSNQQYNKSLFAANVKGNLFDGAVHISTTYIREGDNQDAPLDLTLSDTDQNIIASAGADPLKASKSAVTFVGTDSLGRAQGSYEKADTIISGIAVVFYRYAPLDSVNALYNVAFGYAGTGKGAYTRLAIGEYQFVGPGLGDFDTLAYLPLPVLHQVVAASGNVRISKSLGLMGEFAESFLDPNRFAAIPSITGNAYRFGAMYADSLPALGYTEFRVTERNLGAQFTPIDRISDVEFERQYGNDALAATTPYSSTLPITGEENREADLTIHPIRSLSIGGTYGDLMEPQLAFHSTRMAGHAELLEDSGFTPNASLSIEHLPTTDSSIHEQAAWDRLFAGISKSFQIGKESIRLGAEYGHEKKIATPFDTIGVAADSLTGYTFDYHSIRPLASIMFGNALALSGNYEWRTDDSARFGRVTPISTAHTSHITASLAPIGGFSSSLDLTFRNKTYSDSTSYANNGGNQSTLLLRFEPRYSLPSRGLSMDALYEVSNQRAARLQQVFVPVPTGLGSYYYAGDLNHNGKPDANEFLPATYTDQGDFILVTIPTTQLFPTTDLKSDFHLHLDPKELFGISMPTDWWQVALANISSESYIKLEETSTDSVPSDIYYFRISHFRNDSTTINGLMELGEDLDILTNSSEESLRLHYLERESAAQYTTGLQRAFSAERSIRARFRPSFELSSETTISSRTDQSSGDTLSVNPPHNTASIGLTSNWSYHPIGSKFDYGIIAALTRSEERVYSPSVIGTAEALTLNSSYALETKARLRASVEYDGLNLSNVPSGISSLPYALTQGKSEGVTWLWTLALDYQFGSGIVATLAYDGRNEPSDLLGISGTRQTIHNARAEVRANF